MAWYGWAIILVVVAVASAGFTWLLLRRRTSDPVAEKAREIIKDVRDEKREKTEERRRQNKDDNPVRKHRNRLGDPSE